ncbi:flagellar motor protein MotB [uncultured Robinsoniella sp.]|uniref:flagellar motor protein MotB n=1 Tax=uncultured Robinsoniella sp. TaxID=904190 RepID=UPI00374EBEDF
MFCLRKKNRNQGGGQEWLNTYADMITLVLTFFVLLYSISNVNISKLEKVAEAMQKKLGIEATIDISEVDPNLKVPAISEDKSKNPDQVTAETESLTSRTMEQLTNEIKATITDNNVDASVVKEDDVVYIRFKNDLLFDPDSAVLRESSINLIAQLGNSFKKAENEILAIYINGHTAEAVSPVNDRLLSSQRADNVAIYLEEQMGIAPKKLISRGYGKNYPIADNATKEGRDANRRVDMIVLGKDFSVSDMDKEGGTEFDPLSPVEVPDALNNPSE